MISCHHNKLLQNLSTASAETQEENSFIMARANLMSSASNLSRIRPTKKNANNDEATRLLLTQGTRAEDDDKDKDKDKDKEDDKSSTKSKKTKSDDDGEAENDDDDEDDDGEAENDDDDEDDGDKSKASVDDDDGDRADAANPVTRAARERERNKMSAILASSAGKRAFEANPERVVRFMIGYPGSRKEAIATLELFGGSDVIDRRSAKTEQTTLRERMHANPVPKVSPDAVSSGVEVPDAVAMILAADKQRRGEK
jgi:hypothetical protein